MSPCGAEDHFLLWFSYIIIWTGSDSDCRSAACDWMRGNPHRLNINWQANTCWKGKKTEWHSLELHSFIFLSWDKICIKQALNLLCLSVLTTGAAHLALRYSVHVPACSALLTSQLSSQRRLHCLFVFNYPSCRSSEPNLTAWRSFSAPCRVFMTWPGDPPRLIPIYTAKIAKFLNF